MRKFLLLGLFVVPAAMASNLPMPVSGIGYGGGTGVPLFECSFADLEGKRLSDIVAIAGDLNSGPQVHFYDRQDRPSGWYDVSLIAPPAAAGIKVIAQTNDGGATMRLEIFTKSTIDPTLGVLYFGKVANAVLGDGSEIRDRKILCAVQGVLAEAPPVPKGLTGFWSITSRWNHCNGPIEGPSTVQLFADGTWDTVPSDENQYKDFRWSSSSDGSSFVLSQTGVWAHYFILVEDGRATGHSGDHKGCFEARHLEPAASARRFFENITTLAQKPALTCAPIQGSTCGGGTHCCPPMHCVIEPGYITGKCHY